MAAELSGLDSPISIPDGISAEDKKAFISNIAKSKKEKRTRLEKSIEKANLLLERLKITFHYFLPI
jgi:hypothetical protein